MKTCSLIMYLLLSVSTNQSVAASFSLESPAFKLNTMIPSQYTCDGDNKSPPLNWHDAPAKTQSFVLIAKDPNAPEGEWIHWILFNIPTKITELDAGASIPESASAGTNSWGKTEYRGPCPSLGAHAYVFKLYALDKVLDLGDGANKESILQAMTSHVLGSSELIGLYQKNP